MKRCIFILICFSSSHLLSQNVDSLKQLLKYPIQDTERLRLYDQICEASSNESIDDVYKYALLGKNLSEKYLKGKCRPDLKEYYLERLSAALNSIGFVHYQKNEAIEAFRYFHKAIKIQEELRNKTDLPVYLQNIAVVYEEYGDVIRAIQYNEDALREIKGTKNVFVQTNSAINLGHLYQGEKNFKRAQEMFELALVTFKEVNDEQGVLTTQNYLAVLFSLSGDTASAMKYCNLTLTSAQKSNDILQEAGALNTFAGLLHGKKQYKQALQAYLKAIKILEKLKDDQACAAALRNLAKLHLLLNDLKNAEKYALKAMEYAKISGSIVSIRDQAKVLCEIFTEQRNKKAAKFCELHMLMVDSVNKENRKNELFFSKFNKEYKEYEMKLASEKEIPHATSIEPVQEKKGGYLIVILIVIPLLLIGFYLWRRRK